jgi:hypothetical protein
MIRDAATLSVLPAPIVTVEKFAEMPFGTFKFPVSI